MATMSNPYARIGLTSQLLQMYGYRSQVRSILEKISATPPGSVELLGLPGMGKTTLLRHLASVSSTTDSADREWLQAPFDDHPYRLMPVLVEFRLLPTGKHPLVYIHKRFSEDWRQYRSRAAIDPSLPDDALAPPPERRLADADTAAQVIEEYIQLLKDAGVRTVLLLDDFDLALAHMSYEDATRMRPWRDAVAFVLATELPFHTVQSQAAGSPFFQTIPLERIAGFTVDEARQAVRKPALDIGVELLASDIDFVLQQSGGHPHLLVLAAKSLWDLRAQLNLNDREPLARHEAILRGRLAEDFSRTFHVYLKQLTDAELRILRALSAKTAHPLNGSDLTALASLEAKGIACFDPGTGLYRPFSPLFADFMTGSTGGWSAQQKPIPADMSKLERSLYEYLRGHAGRECTIEELSREVWQSADAEGAKRRIQVTVSRLRNKLRASTGEDILAARDRGYRLVPAQASAVKP